MNEGDMLAKISYERTAYLFIGAGDRTQDLVDANRSYPKEQSVQCPVGRGEKRTGTWLAERAAG